MKITVKKGFNLEALLKELREHLTIDDEGEVSSSDFTTYRDLKDLLINVFVFPSSTKHFDLGVAVSKTIKVYLTGQDKKHTRFIKLLIETCINELKKRESSFTVLTSISLCQENLNKFEVEIQDCKVRFHSRVPENLTGRSEAIAKHGSQMVADELPAGYTIITVEVKSRYANEAFNRALEVLDIVRALINITVNSTDMIFGDAWKPVNKVRYGKVHTIHNELGAALLRPLYFEPNFKSAIPLNYKHDEILSKNTKHLLKKIEFLQYKLIIFSALIRFVRALDESDNNIAVVKLWATLETLLIEDGESCTKIASMISVMFNNSSMQFLLIENIRLYRNTHIHNGVQVDSPIDYSYQLQRCFIRLFEYYVTMKHESLKSANSDLALASEGLEKIDNKRKQLELVSIRFEGLLN